jgi:hypothetical protein
MDDEQHEAGERPLLKDEAAHRKNLLLSFDDELRRQTCWAKFELQHAMLRVDISRREMFDLGQAAGIESP